MLHGRIYSQLLNELRAQNDTIVAAQATALSEAIVSQTQCHANAPAARGLAELKGVLTIIKALFELD